MVKISMNSKWILKLLGFPKAKKSHASKISTEFRRTFWSSFKKSSCPIYFKKIAFLNQEMLIFISFFFWSIAGYIWVSAFYTGFPLHQLKILCISIQKAKPSRSGQEIVMTCEGWAQHGEEIKHKVWYIDADLSIKLCLHAGWSPHHNWHADLI